MSTTPERLAKVVKDPLLHFLAIGAVLFLLLSLAKPPVDENKILVNRDVLLTFIQYRSKAFEPKTAAAILDAMDERERKQLIDNYIREEALYREAQKLGLDDGDYVIRMRMVQKLEFMTTSATAPAEPNEQALTEWYEENKQNYAQQASATFTHIYFSTNNKPLTLALEKATLLKKMLLQNDVIFEDATHYGERFLFHTNYVDRTYDYVKSQFGTDTTDYIFSNDTLISTWVGPVISSHGVHLVFISKRAPSHIPPLQEIASKVARDMMRQESRDETHDLVNSIIENYSLAIDLENPSPKPTQ